MNPVVRGCPICLQNDAQSAPRRPLSRMVMRGHWQFREVGICLAHHHALVPLWKRAHLTDRYDFSARLGEVLQNILSGEFEQNRVEASAYDIWLDGRLETGIDNTWLAGQSIFAAKTFCRLLGAELFRLESAFTLHGSKGVQSAHTLGFQVASKGPEAIRSALNDLAAAADGSGDLPNKAFGDLYKALNQTYLDEGAFDQFREVLRDCIIATWPIAAGEVVLGISQPERQMHSILSAATETGIGAFLLEQFLVNAGSIAEDDNRPIARKTFDAKLNASLLAEVPTLVGPIEMQRVMGATRSQFKALADDKLLTPRIAISTIKAPWRPSDGTALVQELSALAVEVRSADKCWEGIQQAKTRSGVSVGSIISAIRGGILQVGQRPEVFGYSSFEVLMVEIDKFAPAKPALADSSFISAAAFSREVGMRETGWFEKLFSAGHSSASRRPHPTLGGERIYLSEQDIEAFHQRFLTSTTMVSEFAVARQTIIAKLTAAGVKPFGPNCEAYGQLYLRKDVEAVLG